MNVPLASQQLFNGKVNMKHNEEVPDFLGGLGDMLPADVLKVLNELLEQLHRKDKDHQGSPVFIYAPGGQYVDKLTKAAPCSSMPQAASMWINR